MPHTQTVTHDERAHRFEIETDAGVGYLAYRPEPDALVLLHTDVPVGAEGQGVGSALARAALEHARAQGLHAVVLCPFVHGYMQRHPEYADLVRDG
ncbi:MAG TPA: GNAT family N-acetyltransferase [Gemmatimonadaceae bacterium]|nr:GNAT family N-acetyltransferase [Gemmatimonadaceae bacterium]